MFDIAAYWQKVSKDLPEETSKAVLEHLQDEAVATALSKGLIDRSQYDSDLERTRKETRDSAQKELSAQIGQAYKQYYDDWYTRQASPALNQAQSRAQQAEAALVQYQQLYGPLEAQGYGSQGYGYGGQPPYVPQQGYYPQGNPAGSPAGNPAGYPGTVPQPPAYPGTPNHVVQPPGQAHNDIMQILQNMGTAAVDMEFDGMGVLNHWHRHWPQEAFPEDDFRTFAEKHATEHPGARVRDMYREFVSPRLEKLQQEQHEAALAAAREEGARDALSKHQTPVDGAPREPSLTPFAQAQQIAAERAEKNQGEITDREKHDAFVQGWHDFGKPAEGQQ